MVVWTENDTIPMMWQEISIWFVPGDSLTYKNYLIVHDFNTEHTDSWTVKLLKSTLAK